MSTHVNVEGMSLAPGVIETIISLTASEVEGVACVGTGGASGLLSSLGSKPSTAGIDAVADEDGKLVVSIHVEVFYGQVLPKLAADLREAVSEALLVQVGVEVSAVDVYIDGIRFAH